MKNVLSKIFIISVLLVFTAYSAGIVVVNHHCLICKIKKSSIFIHEDCSEADHSHITKHIDIHHNANCCNETQNNNTEQLSSLYCLDDIDFLHLENTFVASEFQVFSIDIPLFDAVNLLIQEVNNIKNAYIIKIPPDKLQFTKLSILFSEYLL